ncbi:DUF3617 family protein [Asticcacaulis sp. AC402]|uniref:DUF3617 domain-containing protein n=1 Tax=Asticcacaulis sp. AC402 TaxID=1282361 RepID=UPI0003C3AF1E|nr:DUF3617 family protein [Asticcacaulis sp. AC402]ESQ75047.1 hypothetical protein ABAC402_11625 [Asticcacaulis sp. AC402]
MSQLPRLAAACLLLSAGGLMTASEISAQTGPQQYEISIDTSVNGAEVENRMTYMCMGAAQLNRPIEKLTGPRCPNQTFQRSGDSVTWTAQCAAAKGEGRITFSGDGKSFSGESTVTAGGKTVRTQVKGEVIDACSL